MTEGGGIVAADLMGGNDATLTGGPTWTPGSRGPVVSFDGSNDHAITDNAVYLSGGQFTVSMWIRPATASSTANVKQPFNKARATTASNNSSLLFSWSHTSSGFQRAWATNNGSGYTARKYNVAMAANEWHNIALVYDGTNSIAYYNGIEDARGAAATPSDSNLPVFFGSGQVAPLSPASFFDGQIDDVKIYSRPLAADDMSQLYADPFAMFRPRQRSYFAFFDGGAVGQVVTVTQAVETESAFGLTVSNPRSYVAGQATEAEHSFTLDVVNPRSYIVTQSDESEQAFGLVVQNPRAYEVGQSVEQEAAFGLTVENPRVYEVGQATETEQAYPLSVLSPGAVTVGQAAETEQAFSLAVTNPRAFTVGQASEVESAFGLVVEQVSEQTITVGQAIETEIALPLIVVSPRTYTVGQSIESEQAFGLVVSGGVVAKGTLFLGNEFGSIPIMQV